MGRIGFTRYLLSLLLSHVVFGHGMRLGLPLYKSITVIDPQRFSHAAITTRIGNQWYGFKGVGYCQYF